MNLIKFLLPLLVFISSTATADLVGSWDVGGGQQVTIYYKDDNHIRMEVGNDTYMLVINEKAYSVMNQGGQLVVIDMASMGSAMQSLGGMVNQQVQETASKYDPSTAKISKTGRREEIAGYKGDVYKISIQGPKGLETSELVSSKHADVVNFQRAFMKISEKMARSMLSKNMLKSFNKAAKMAGEEDIGGILRYAKSMKLKTLKNKTVNDAVYALPKNAMIMSIPSFGR